MAFIENLQITLRPAGFGTVRVKNKRHELIFIEEASLFDPHDQARDAVVLGPCSRLYQVTDFH